MVNKLKERFFNLSPNEQFWAIFICVFCLFTLFITLFITFPVAGLVFAVLVFVSAMSYIFTRLIEMGIRGP